MEARACMLRLPAGAQLDWLGSAVICVKAVAVLLSPEPRHAMYRSSDTLALLAMFAALGLAALLAPAWCAPGRVCNPKPNFHQLQRHVVMLETCRHAVSAPVHDKCFPIILQGMVGHNPNPID